MNANTRKILEMADGQRTATEIAAIVGLTPRYVRKVMQRWDAPRLGPGARRGEANPSWRGGRHVDLDGYVTVPTPEGHPGARRIGRILEHRLVMERALGRPLEPTEVVDHIDGLTLHNAPSNLRVFASNGDHLRETLRGRPRRWSEEGYRNIGARTDLGAVYQPVDSYQQRLRAGEIRLRQILLAALSLGIDSPHLSGTHRHLERARIDWSERSNLERALVDLYRKWGWPQTP